MSDLYSAAGGPLKLSKSSSKNSKKKKSKKRKEENKTESIDGNEEERSVQRPSKRKTPAEIAFQEAKRKKQDKEMLKKAEKTHKERIMDLNSHLDSLSEHYDIPKVSWTK